MVTLRDSVAGVVSSIPGSGIKIPRASHAAKKKKKERKVVSKSPLTWEWVLEVPLERDA